MRTLRNAEFISLHFTFKYTVMLFARRQFDARIVIPEQERSKEGKEGRAWASAANVAPTYRPTSQAASVLNAVCAFSQPNVSVYLSIYLSIGAPLATSAAATPAPAPAPSSTYQVQEARSHREDAERRAAEARAQAEAARHEAAAAIAQYESQQKQQLDMQAQREAEARTHQQDLERQRIQVQREEAVRKREEAERSAHEARERAEALRASAASAVAEYEAQQRAMLEREESRKQMELERKRQEQLQLAEQARARRESAEKQAIEAKLHAEQLREQALAAQRELERQEEQRRIKQQQREEARRLREEAERREANRLKAEENERLAFEARKQAEQLRLEALRLSTMSTAPVTPARSSSFIAPSVSAGSDTCAKCFAGLKPTQKFCLQCGTKREGVLAAAGPPAPLISSPDSSTSSLFSSSTSSLGGHSCANCQASLKPAQKFCPKCGTAVASKAAATSSAPPLTAASSSSSLSSVGSVGSLTSSSSFFSGPPAATGAAPLACVNCSQPLKPTQKFCLQCGTKVQAAVPVSLAPPPAPVPTYTSSAFLSPPTSAPFNPLSSGVALPAPIPLSSSYSASSMLPATKNCKTCGIECKYAAKFCVSCGFNFAKDEDEEVARNMEAARQRTQLVKEREMQQRSHASMIASQAAHSMQPGQQNSNYYSHSSV